MNNLKRKFTRKGAWNTMKPSKRNANLTGGNPIIEKLLKLKYRINDAFKNTKLHKTLIGDTRIDKQWVMNLIDDVRDNLLTKLCREDMLKCNGLWRKYETK